MRTSNKILSGTLLLILLIIAGVHVALYAKYNRNDFITMKNLHEERYDSYDLKGIQSVSITGLRNVSIIPSDTARVEIEKSKEDKRLLREFVNGILTIKGDTLITENNGSTQRINNYREVLLYLPKTQIVKSAFCGLNIRGGKDSSNATTLTLDLEDTELNFGFYDKEGTSAASSFDKVTITKASGGSIGIANDIRIKEMSMNLESSRFSDGGANFGAISIITDSSSSVTLSGKNISKTKVTLK